MKNLIFLFMPHYWIMNGNYSANWDKKLNELLDTYEFTEVDRYTAKLGSCLIWIANYPYACFIPRKHTHGGFRASRLTILRAKNKLKKAGAHDPYTDTSC